MDNLLTVGKVFSDRVFRVPDYQRGYAWEERQRQDFIEDLELLSKGKKHFLGLLILCPRSGDSVQVLSQTGQSYTVYDVVDGQQRLTTIVLFLDALRREMQQFEHLRTLATGLEETFVTMRNLNGQPVSKLTLNRDTHPYFQRVVLGGGEDLLGPIIRSHQLLRDAKTHFAKYLGRMRSELEDYAEWLKDQYFKITQHMTLVVYHVETESDAGVVFETMNNRGQELTELEKVKNYLLYLASKLDLPAEHGLDTEINDTWTHIFEHLMAAGLGSLRNEDQLLRAHWLMAYDHDPATWIGSRSIKAHFNLRGYQNAHQSLLADLQAYLASLRNATVAYCDVLSPAHANAFGNLRADKEMRASIVSWGARLARIGAPATFLPLLMAARIRRGDDGQAYLDALKLCESYAFRVYWWAKLRSNAGQSRLFRAGNDLFKTGDIQRTLREIHRAILDYAPDKEFSRYFEPEARDWFDWRGLKYMLYEYEQHLADEAGQPVLIPWEELQARKQDTVEHILPQKMEGIGYWTRRFTPKRHERWVHDIGNLTLTYDNSTLARKAFPDKKGSPEVKGCYASSPLFVERQLARYDDWTETEIEHRRQEILQWAAERWRVPSVAAGDDHMQDSPDLGEDEGGDLIEDIQHVLTRTFIPAGQMAVYHTLYRAGGRWVPSSELSQAIAGAGRRAVNGALGALGKRINNTPRFKQKRPGVGLLFEIEFHNGEWSYRLRPATRAAIDGLPGLQEIMTWQLEDVRATYRDEWWADWSAQRRQLGI